jgi:hypothetical protein
MYFMAGLNNTLRNGCFAATAAILDIPNIVPQISGAQNVSTGVTKTAPFVVVYHV